MESFFGGTAPFTMNTNPMDNNPYPAALVLPEDCSVCQGWNENCAFHQTGVTVDRIEPDNTLWQAGGMELSSASVNLSHFTTPVNNHSQLGSYPSFQSGQVIDNQFAALSLDQQQPLDITLSIQAVYNPGDKTTVPDPSVQIGIQNYVPDFQCPDGNVPYIRNDEFSIYSEPLPQRQTERQSYARVAKLDLDIEQQLRGDTDPRYLSPQTDSGINPFQPNGSPSEPTPSSPVLKKKAPRLQMSMRNDSNRTSRRATIGNSSRRASSPGARSVTSRVSTASRRGRNRKPSYSRHLHPQDANLQMELLPCARCDKTFQNRSELHHHELIHGDRDFVCETCGKGFIWKKDLTRHMPKHTKEKPYKCENCSKSFTRHDNLRRHYGTDHPDLMAPSCSSRNGSGTVNSSQS